MDRAMRTSMYDDTGEGDKGVPGHIKDFSLYLSKAKKMRGFKQQSVT